MGLTELRRHLNETVFGSSDFFGVSCTFTPQKGLGASREVRGSVSVNVVIDENSDPQGFQKMEQCELEVNRFGEYGIATIEPKDLLLLGVDRDPQQIPFAFTGERRSENEQSWTLIFHRGLTSVKGGS